MNLPHRPIRIAAQLHPQHGAWRELRSAAVRSEELGYDILYTWDHFSPLYGEPDGKHFEAWTMLGAWAGHVNATATIDIRMIVRKLLLSVADP